MAEPNPLTRTQLRRNAESAGSWLFGESHRQRLTQLLLNRRMAEQPNLCVLGAGNCNDLDLQKLTAAFSSVELFDLDSAAMRQGITSQQCEDCQSIHLHGDCDLTGVWHPLAALVDTDEQDARIDQLLADSTAWKGLPDVDPCGTVVSACLLSQIVDGVIQVLGETHPRCLEVIAALRARHLRLLFDLTAPGGWAILATDFVSSDTAPTLPTLAGQALEFELQRMISQHNFFTGLNPFRLQALVNEEPYFEGQLKEVRCEKPWLWNYGPRYYAVTAVCFRRAGLPTAD